MTYAKTGLESFYKTSLINEHTLLSFCQKEIEDFYEYGDVSVTPDGVYIYNQQPETTILAVAHLDTVEEQKSYARTLDRFYAPQLDDRLGAYIILDLLPQFGFKFDVLLTEGEESGRSTARHFETQKEYNWIFEVDRSGTDVVMYQFETEFSRKLLEDHDFKVGIGTYTDIVCLDLGVLAFNFGCAYYDHHSVYSYTNLRELESMLLKLINFISQNQHLKFKFDPKDSIELQHYYTRDFNSDAFWYVKDDVDLSLTICPTCNTRNFKAEDECFVCGDYLGASKKVCQVCSNKYCTGLKICNLCDETYHDDIFVTEFDYCGDCLQGVFDVPLELLETFEDYSIIEDTKALKYGLKIKEAISKI